MIDELDRCRPTYAIELLETIKHYLNVENYTFIFALDKNQLSHSIKTQYGSDMDSSGYLRRFFDYILNFPVPSNISFIESQLSRMNLDTLRRNQLIYSVEGLAKAIRLSCRDIKIIISNFIIIWETVLGSQVINHYIMESYIFTIALKYSYPLYYKYLLEENKEYLNGVPIDINLSFLTLTMTNAYNKLHSINKLTVNNNICLKNKSGQIVPVDKDYFANEDVEEEPNFNLYFLKYGNLPVTNYVPKLFVINGDRDIPFNQQLSQQLEMISND